MKRQGVYGIIILRDINSLLRINGARDQKEVLSMNKYELTVVVNAKVEDEERTAIIDKCKALVERFGGTVTNVDDWGKRRLAYEVQHMKEAFYYFIQFDADAKAPAEIESRVRIMDNVVRFLCVKREEA